MVYVGITCNIKNRYSKYKNNNIKDQPAIYNSILKHGFGFHQFKIIISNIELTIAEEYEKKLIRLYKQNKKSLNCQGGGFAGVRDRDSPMSKKTLQFNIDGDIIKEWDSLMQIERELGFSVSALSSACLARNGSNFSYGFLWLYR